MKLRTVSSMFQLRAEVEHKLQSWGEDDMVWQINSQLRADSAICFLCTMHNAL